jgi:5-formyltetrahydrofolate cyclo-ligase
MTISAKNHSNSESRRYFRRLRRNLTPAQQRQAAAGLARVMKHQKIFLYSRRIAFYICNDGEIDPELLLESALKMSKQCYLPVLKPDFDHPKKNQLLFSRCGRNSCLIPNKFGIYEPDIRQQPWISPQSLDLILLPLVAFDLSGNRLGMGKGYYDRSLEFISGGNYWHRPRLLGLAHECQLSDGLVSNDWDVPLDGIVTDRMFYSVSQINRSNTD